MYGVRTYFRYIFLIFPSHLPYQKLLGSSLFDFWVCMFGVLVCFVLETYLVYF